MTRFSARLEALPKYPLTGIAAAKLRLPKWCTKQSVAIRAWEPARKARRQ